MPERLVLSIALTSSSGQTIADSVGILLKPSGPPVRSWTDLSADDLSLIAQMVRDHVDALTDGED